MPDIGNQQPKTFTTKSKPPRRLLAIKMRALGDTVLLTGTLRVLQDRYPHWHIDVMVSPTNAPLLENLSFIHQIIVAQEPKGLWSRLRYWSGLTWKLRKTNYDAVLVFHSTNKMGFLANRIAGSRGLCIVNHHGLETRNDYSHRPVPGRGEVKANIDRDLDVLRAMGEKVELSEAIPELRLTAAERQNAAVALQTARAGEKKGPLLFLGIGASRPTKRWPIENTIEMLSLILQRVPDARFMMCTIKNDQQWLQEFNDGLLKLGEKGALLDAKIIRFSDLPLRQVMARLAHCQVYIGNDSGLKHIAVGLGVATLTMFGPENPIEWHPYSRDRHPFHFIEDEQMPCRKAQGQHWCSIPICLEEGHRCMKNLSAQNAAQEVFRLLEALPLGSLERFTQKND